jgi:hypothetical protein
VQLSGAPVFETFGERPFELGNRLRGGKVREAGAIVFGRASPHADGIGFDRRVQTFASDLATGTELHAGEQALRGERLRVASSGLDEEESRVGVTAGREGQPI